MGEDPYWRENSKYILESLTEFRNDFKEFKCDIQKEISAIKVEVATIKTEMRIKAGIWGVLGGAIASTPAVIVLIMQLYGK